ncbi:MAG: CoA-binding protein, partial [Nitrososphaerota archaeon]|nr:CoA-binding protein [Candidatus Bathyarchaeota archaeon]MDW8194606.1 CoA-binding protein [Nitrososphaerota archaeon]
MDDVTEILAKYRIVAIVGLSKDPSKDSYRVAEYLKKHGFKIVPINPFAEEILGEKSYKSLLDLPTDVQKSLEIIDVFRPSQDVPIIVEQAIKLRKLYGKTHVI